MIFQTNNSGRSNKPSGCKDIGVRKCKFVGKTQFLWDYSGNLKVLWKSRDVIEILEHYGISWKSENIFKKSRNNLDIKNILKLWKYIENQNYYETKEALMEAMNLHPKKRTKKNAKIPKTFLSFVPVAGKICEWALKP